MKIVFDIFGIVAELRAEQWGVHFSAGKTNSPLHQSGPGHHPASYSTGNILTGFKAAGVRHWSLHSSPSATAQTYISFSLKAFMAFTPTHSQKPAECEAVH